MRSSHSARHWKIADTATTLGPVEAIAPLIYDKRVAARKAATKRDGAA